LLAGSCHGGDVRVAIPRKPRFVTSCNCSICRRYGTLWGYYRMPTVRIDAEPGALVAYRRGSGNLDFMRCRRCGCVTHWQAAVSPEARRAGINLRNFALDLIDSLRVRRLEGANDSWRFLD
jgi:hypothetical protein